MVTSSRTAIMSRAWAIFAETYQWPRTPFNSIGRHCFGWALRKAWAEARAAAELAAAPVEQLVSTVARAEREISDLTYRPCSVNIGQERRRLDAILRETKAELARRGQFPFGSEATEPAALLAALQASVASEQMRAAA